MQTRHSKNIVMSLELQICINWYICDHNGPQMYTGFTIIFNRLHSGDTLFHSTCKDLTQPSEIEESTLRHCEQLTQEHQEGHRGENHWDNHQDLNCLKPLWKKKTSKFKKTNLALRFYLWETAVYVNPLLWKYGHRSQSLPVSLVDEHNQVPVKLSNLQLYHRSEFSNPSQTHQDLKDCTW